VNNVAISDSDSVSGKFPMKILVMKMLPMKILLMEMLSLTLPESYQACLPFRFDAAATFRNRFDFGGTIFFKSSDQNDGYAT